MTPSEFDFRKPPPGELVRQTAGWLAQACRRAGGPWSRLLPYPAELKPGPVEAVTASAGLASLPEDATGIPVTTADPADGVVVLAIRRPLLLALLAGLVGETPAELPKDREVTEVEASLIGYLARELFLGPLERGWSAPEPPAFAPGPATAPRGAWAGAGGDAALLATAVVTTPFGESPVHLLLPRAGRWERLARLDTGTRAAAPGPREQIEALVREMPVDLAVVLGTADLTMHALASLKTGDVVVLRQKVTQPLDGMVSGARKFRVWPGVIGTRSAVVIDAPADA